MRCTTERHEKLKTDPKAWRKETVPPHGYTVRPVTADEENWLEWANCRKCQSTLARPVNVALKLKF